MSFPKFVNVTKNIPYFPILHAFAPLNDVRTYIAWSWKTTLIMRIFFTRMIFSFKYKCPPEWVLGWEFHKPPPLHFMFTWNNLSSKGNHFQAANFMKYYVTCKHTGGVFEMLLNFVQINCASCSSSAGKSSDSESISIACIDNMVGPK